MAKNNGGHSVKGIRKDFSGVIKSQKPAVRYIARSGRVSVGSRAVILPVNHPNKNTVTGDGKTWAITSPVVRIEQSLDGLIIETENTRYIPGGAG